MNKKKLKKKNVSLAITLAVALAYACVLLLFPGAIDNNGDISDKLLIVTLGMDLSDEGLTVSGISVEPQATGADGGVVVSSPVSASGRTISECIVNIEHQTGKVVDLGLCGVIVLGERLSTEGVKTLLEIVLSSNLVSPGAYLIQADGMNAEEFVDKSAKLSENSATVLTQLIKDAQKSTGVITTNLLRFLSETEGVSESAVVPLVSVSELKPEQGGSGSSEQDGEGSGEKKYRINSVENMAVFRAVKWLQGLTEISLAVLRGQTDT